MKNPFLSHEFYQIRQTLAPLDTAEANNDNSLVQRYLRFYQLDFADTGHIIGTFSSHGIDLVGEIFIPENTRGTMIILHGYLNHSGQNAGIIRFLLEHHYTAAVFDLPGHGLSGGARGYISDFSQYSDALRDFYTIVHRTVKGPYHLLGHSTGGAAILQYLLTNKKIPFDKVILAAPLVRSKAWQASKVGYILYKPLGRRLPRKWQKNTSDKEYLEFMKKRDPLQVRYIPLGWIKAMFDWNKAVEKLEPVAKPLLMLQGTKDNTVDWKYNEKFIRKKFPHCEIKHIPGARHGLLYEGEKLRHEVFADILAYLEAE